MTAGTSNDIGSLAMPDRATKNSETSHITILNLQKKFGGISFLRDRPDPQRGI